ncbi:uncharacterized protein [Anabrus simplex]|uniref:uncharacterized protein n=1 Tax=Anabrus simplex TaxID=316456 RepID=UPI0035A31357
MDACFKDITLKEVLDILEADDSEEETVKGIFIEPPEVNVPSDEDSGDEDGGGLVDNLTGRQLSSKAEIVYTNNVRLGGCATDDTEQADTSAKKKKTNIYSWNKCNLLNQESVFPEPDYTLFRDKSPVQCFET